MQVFLYPLGINHHLNSHLKRAGMENEHFLFDLCSYTWWWISIYETRLVGEYKESIKKSNVPRWNLRKTVYLVSNRRAGSNIQECSIVIGQCFEYLNVRCLWISCAGSYFRKQKLTSLRIANEIRTLHKNRRVCYVEWKVVVDTR